MKRNHSITLASLIVLMMGVQACKVTEEYRRPDVAGVVAYAGDSLVQDSAGIAMLPWREIFQDSLLARLVEEGLSRNFDMRAALRRIDIAAAYYERGKAGLMPVANLNAAINHQQFSNNSQFGRLFSGGLTQYELTGNISWEPDLWGRIRAARRGAEAEFLQTGAAQKAVQTRLVASIAGMYYQLQALDRQLDVTRATIDNRASGLETTRGLKTAGLVTEVAVLQTEAQVLAAQAVEENLLRNRTLLEHSLSLLLGRSAGPVERSSAPLQIAGNFPPATGVPADLLRNRPDVIAAEYQLVSAFEMTNVAKTNFYPRLTLGATTGIQSIEPDKLFSLNSLFANVMGGLTQPLLDGRANKTQLEVSRQQQELAVIDFHKALVTAGVEVSDALAELASAGRLIALKAREVELYRQAVSYSEELLESGLSNYLEVLNARQNVLSAELELVNARLQREQAFIELYRALGGGWR